MTGVRRGFKTLLGLTLLLFAFASSAQVRQPFTALSNNADTANKKLYVEVMYEKPGCGDYMAMFTLVNRAGVSTPLDIDSVLNNAGTYQLSTDRRALMRPQAGGYRLRFSLLPNASVNDGYRVVISTHKLAYRCEGCGAAGSDAIFEPKHVKAGCPPLEGEVLACHQRTGRMANWEAWIQDPRTCNPYRVVMLPDGRWWFSQNLRWSELGQRAADGSSLYTWYEAIIGKEAPDSAQLLVNINSDETGPQGVCPAGWHVPTEREWHKLGVSMGSGAAILIDTWKPQALHGLASFNYYGTTGLREGNDESGFTWMPTPFTSTNGINGGSVKHGALWSAGAMSDSPGDTTISRVAAQATATAWSANPLTADNRAGSRLRDLLPVRCAYGVGVPPTVESVPLPPPNEDDGSDEGDEGDDGGDEGGDDGGEEEEEDDNGSSDSGAPPCTVGCLCGLIANAGAIAAAEGCSAAVTHAGAIAPSQPAACTGSVLSAGAIGCLE